MAPLIVAGVKESLPIDAAVPEILSALRKGPAVVLEAPPGAGKTTRVPPALLDLVQGEVVVLEPRRIAARAAARRVASELDDPDLVGWKIRFDQSGTARTRLWYVTEGILARRLLADPQLAGVGAIVLDEFHERHLPGDLSLALSQRLLPAHQAGGDVGDAGRGSARRASRRADGTQRRSPPSGGDRAPGEARRSASG